MCPRRNAGRRPPTRSWLERRFAPSRHTTYFEILDALQQDGCPLCRLAARALSWYLDMLSYEGVNDPGIRARLRASRGFCNEHAWQFDREVRNGAGKAIIYRDLVRQSQRALDEPSLAERLAPAGQCPACRSLAGATRRYLETFVLHLGDAELRRRCEASSGLCLPHLIQVLPRVRRPGDVDLLLAATARRVMGFRAAAPAGLRGQAPPIAACMVARPGAVLPGGEGPAAAGGAEQPPWAEEVEAALQGEACPVCRAAVAAADRYLAFLASVERAQETHGGTARALALCNAHAWRSLELLAPGAAVRLWLPAARQARGALCDEAGRKHEVAVPPGLLGRLGLRRGEGAGALAVPGLSLRRPCSACGFQAGVERRAVVAFAAQIEQGPDARQLCLPHLTLALRMALDGRQKRALIAAQQAALRALSAQLEEYIRKQDYRCREAAGEEAASPWQAMAHVSGAKGLGSGLRA